MYRAGNISLRALYTPC